MDDDSIYTVNRKFKVIYEVSQQSELDYGLFLEGYQKAVYQVASKVRGSGEWYYYYDRDLKKLISNNNLRKTQMGRYLKAE